MTGVASRGPVLWRHLVSVACALAVWLWTGPCAADSAEEPLLYSWSLPAPYQTAEGDGLADRLIGELFQRLGLQIENADVPPARVYELLEKGIIDARIGTPDSVPFMKRVVRVPEALGRDEIVALSKSVTALPRGWASLADHPVAYLEAWKVIAAEIPPGDNVYALREPGQLFAMLDSGRVEIVVGGRLLSLLQLRQSGVEGVRVIQPPLKRFEAHLYLHEKHAALVPPLDAALRAMKADGTYRRIYDETLRDFGIE